MADVPIVNGNQNSMQSTPIKPEVSPAGSAVPNQNLTTSPNPTAANPANQRPKSNSPWDDDIDVPEVASNSPSIVGSLDPKNIPPGPNTAPLKVPENIEEKVGQKVPATDFMDSSENQPTPLPPSSPPPTPPKADSPGLLGGLFGKKKESPLNPLKPADIPSTITPEASPDLPLIPPPPPLPPLPPSPPLSKPVSNKPIQNTANKKGSPALKRILVLVPGILLVFALATFLTEVGLLSIGVEKVYGALGVEQFWGGLSPKTETALGRSALEMQSHPDFKGSGTISITIDKAIKSDVVTPLISLETKQSLARDESINPAENAIKAASDDYYFTTNSNSNSNSNFNTNSNRITNSNSVTAPPTNANTNTNSNANTNSAGVSEVESTIGTKVVEGTFDLKTATAGNEATIKLNDSSSSVVTLVNDTDKLYVKTSGSVNYGSIDETKWVAYTFDQLKNESLISNIFNLKTESGFSVKGARVANEKIENVRCYKYRIDSLEIGSSLSGIGVTSDMVPTLSGDVWIGIKDKLIHQMNIKITTPVSSAVRMVSLDMSFSDFDVKNSITKVASTDQVAPENLTGDAKRKADVVVLLAALKKYKDDNKSYPVSTELLKLNTADNAIMKALVPRYLTSMPEDSKTTEGWYYAYKSTDGTKCSISARLENTSDPEGSLINSTLLYLKYSSD